MGDLDAKLGDQRRFSFTSTALPAKTFAVLELTGQEAISRPYEFTLALVSEEADLPLESMLNRSATLTIHGRRQGGEPIRYHGVVRTCEQLHQIGGYTLYRAVLVPRLWLLSQSQVSEVYVGETIPQMIEKVLAEASLGEAAYEIKLAARYKVWSYYCQYQETNLAFISRLMERVGIYYFFAQMNGHEQVRLVDAQTFHGKAARTIFYTPPGVLEQASPEEGIQSYVCRVEPLPKKVVLQDYNYEKASMELLAEAEVDPNGSGESRIYGEHFETPDEGQRLARIRAQEFLCRGKRFFGESTAAGLQAGYVFKLERHYRRSFNGDYLATEVRHQGSQADLLREGLGVDFAAQERGTFYRNEFTAIPAATQFRPPRVTPYPKVEGTLSAFVDAEGSGQYAEVDDQGRYKVQVPFDKTDKPAGKASTWIRKTSQYSGRDRGLTYPLPKGTEVLLAFVNGDLNQPVIMGAVHNSENRNMVTRLNQTQTVLHTGGSNRMVIEDMADSEFIHLSTPKHNTRYQMGTGAQSTVGAQASSSTDGFSFSTDANWTVSAEDGSTTLQNDTLKVSDTQQETIGRQTTTYGVPADIYKEAMCYFPIMSFWGSPTVKRTVYGAESQSIYGQSSKTVIGKSGGTYVGAAGDIYVTVPGAVQVPCISSSGHMYIGSWGDLCIGTYGKTIVGEEQIVRFANVTEFATSKWEATASTRKAIGSKLETLGSKIQSVGEKIVSAVSSIRSSNSMVVVEEIELTDRGTRVGNTGVDVEESGTVVWSSDMRVDETATEIKSGDVEMTTFGVTMLG